MFASLFSSRRSHDPPRRSAAKRPFAFPLSRWARQGAHTFTAAAQDGLVALRLLGWRACWWPRPLCCGGAPALSMLKSENASSQCTWLPLGDAPVVSGCDGGATARGFEQQGERRACRDRRQRSHPAAARWGEAAGAARAQRPPGGWAQGFGGGETPFRRGSGIKHFDTT